MASSNAGLQGIVTGPDGALWITQSLTGSRVSNNVIRLTTSGQTKTFTVGAGPSEICVGPDKALWFTELDGGAIGRLTTAGKFKEYKTHYKYFEPFGIAAGPDGALWFTVFNGTPSIGRITTKGKMKLFSLPSDTGGVEITPGPDGAMWFTTSLIRVGVGRITLRR